MRHIRIFLLLILLFFNAICIYELNAQSITWEKLYGFPNSDEGAYDVCKSSDGNFFVVGSSGHGFLNTRVYVLKINQYGDTLWTKKFNAGHYAYAVAPTNDCGCVITGYGIDSSYTLKLDCNGNIAWQRFYSTGGILLDIIRTFDGGYIACGYNGFNGYIMKIDSLGNLERDSRIQADINMFLYSISKGVNSENNYVCVGAVRDSDRLKGIIINIDLSGKILWTNRVNINNRVTTMKSIDVFKSIYVISGSIPGPSDSLGNTIYQTFFSKMDSTGTIYFTYTFPSNSIENNHCLKTINGNEYVIISDSYATIVGDSINAIIRKCDSLGNISYRRNFYSNGYISLLSALPLENKDIIFTGINKPVPGSNDDYAYIIRTDSTLNSKPLLINQLNYLVPEEFNLYQNFPNPFNPQTKIKFDIKKSGFVTIKIYDISGKEIQTLVNENLKEGSYEVLFDKNVLSSGVYFYKFVVDSFGESKDFIEVKRMVLIK